MGDVGEIFEGYNRARREKREANRASSPRMLEAARIPYGSYNNGSHLIVKGGPLGFIDFWPGTGLWIVRAGKVRGRGVANLIKLVLENYANGKKHDD